MSQLYSIIVGSVLGASEYVADALAEQLQANGDQADIHLTPTLDEINEDSIWIICTSTHGAGDLPDNIVEFAKDVKGNQLDNIEFYVVGLGDSSYDTFCYAAVELEELMTKSGATLIADALHIDVLNHPIPEDYATEWFAKQLEQQG